MSQDKKTNYTYKLFRVKHSDGKSTTVSVDPVLVTTAIKVLGDSKEVGKVVREASLKYTKDAAQCSRSRYVSRQLMETISSRQQAA